MDIKAHWEKIYADKSDQEVSWYQPFPETSLQLIDELKLGYGDAIIDIGGGNSNLTAALFKKGYTDLTVLDISEKSLNRMRQKLGVTFKNIKWVESDVKEFLTIKKYKLWYDRAAFHFLTSKEDKMVYVEKLIQALEPKGYFILSTFSSDGPGKCSGLDICQYNLASLKSIFEDSFELLNVFNEDHVTPFETKQNFIFSIWKTRN